MDERGREAAFEKAFAEAIDSRRRRGGRPRKAYRDQLIVLAVEAARRAGFKLSLASSRSAFDEAARVLRLRHGQRLMTANTVRIAYEKRQRIEKMKGKFAPWTDEVS